MNSHEIRQIANILLECETAIWDEGGTDAMMLHLHRLYEVRQWVATEAPLTSDKVQRFMLRLMHKKTRTLRRQIEERLGVRN